MAQLWEQRCIWRADDGADDIPKRVFSEELDKRGFQADKGSKGIRIRRGIGLQATDQEPP